MDVILFYQYYLINMACICTSILIITVQLLWIHLRSSSLYFRRIESH